MPKPMDARSVSIPDERLPSHGSPDLMPLIGARRACSRPHILGDPFPV